MRLMPSAAKAGYRLYSRPVKKDAPPQGERHHFVVRLVQPRGSHAWHHDGPSRRSVTERRRPRGPLPVAGAKVILRHCPARIVLSCAELAEKQSPDASGLPKHSRGPVVVTTPTKLSVDVVEEHADIRTDSATTGRM